MERHGTWLVPDGRDRERLLDMNRRLEPVRRKTLAVVAIGAIAAAPWLGWWILAPLLGAAALFKLTDARVNELTRPEYGIFAMWVVVQLVIAATVVLSGGPHSPALPWLALPIAALIARFSTRGVILGVALTIALLLAVSFGVDSRAVVDNPTFVIATATLILGITIMSTALMRSDIEHRDAAVIDPLTGLLNRKALHTRAAELAQQSAVTGAPVGVVVADLDAFKEVNDEHGHAVGDTVLKDVAYAIRKRMRAFDLVYRLGGEEIVILLPGSDLAQSVEIAEQIRTAVSATPAGGLDFTVTISCGVAASEEGERFDYARVFAAADEALYEAKRSGRNRVCQPSLTLAPALA